MTKTDITFSQALHDKNPQVRMGLLSAKVNVVKEIEALNHELEKSVKIIESDLQHKNEKDFPEVLNTRIAYKVCGKEPSRYRPSAEALLKRIRTGKGLYRINNVVDTINLLSIETHYSIGGFDHDKIVFPIMLDIGDNAPYHAIGRGLLNIEFMPGMRDEIGFFGTPTSDSERTMVTNEIENLLLIFYDFGGDNSLTSALDLAQRYVKDFCLGTEIEATILAPTD